ncbi:hypothetical protein Tco_0907852 [Tanacetum coccineum]|uniref:Gag-Pol polyprotein n=1 Tax=Tanacetum coccineum TaxID=301880 RepID=A0ABQ5CLW1_9ASTR
MLTLTVSQTKPKNIKEAMADSAWIESMHEELHQFDRLYVWELVKPVTTQSNVSNDFQKPVTARILPAEIRLDNQWLAVPVRTYRIPSMMVNKSCCNIQYDLGNASRTANILEHKTPRCSTLSNTPLSSNSFAARRDSSILHIWFKEDYPSKGVYYVVRAYHNIYFSVGQFCDADLEVAFRKSTCYIRDLKGNDLLTDPLPLNIHSTHPTPTQVPTVTAPENIHQAETNTENAQFDDDEFINLLKLDQDVKLRKQWARCVLFATHREFEPTKELKGAMADSDGMNQCRKN